MRGWQRRMTKVRQIIRVERNQKLNENQINWHSQLIMIVQIGMVRMV